MMTDSEPGCEISMMSSNANGHNLQDMQKHFNTWDYVILHIILWKKNYFLCMFNFSCTGINV